jgi:ubiquinone/menaquinone biosynthesis C-methylase UbiE
MQSALQRVLEPEVMDTWEEAVAYDAMDFTEVNTAFCEATLALVPLESEHLTVLDVGTGTARIPILLCQMLSRQQRPLWQITGIDLAASMLKIGAANVAAAQLEPYIHLAQVDAKRLPYADASQDLVISNSIIHHLPDPLPFLKELRRVLKPNGGLLLRDLLRPQSEDMVQDFVARIGPEYDDHQQQLFADSLRAAFTLAEVQDLFSEVQLFQAQQSGAVTLYQSSDRHWTAARKLQS